MQKTSNKWSILIWAIFLSLIISVTFISISTKINKNLKNYSSFADQVNEQSEIKNIINSWNLTNKYLESWDKIIFSSANITSFWLKKWETKTSIIWVNSNITIQIKDGWPIKYKNWYNSWIILNAKLINVDSNNNLELTNLWWYSKIIMQSDSDQNTLNSQEFYKVIKQIWNKEVIKTKWIIKNF